MSLASPPSYAALPAGSASSAADHDSAIVVLSVEGVAFPVLRCILVANSLTLREILASEKSGSLKKDKLGRPVIVLQGESAADVELFLRFITPELKRPVNMTTEDIFGLLHLASLLRTPILSTLLLLNHSSVLYLCRTSPSATFGRALTARPTPYLAIARLALSFFSIKARSVFEIPEEYKEKMDARVLVRMYEVEILAKGWEGVWGREAADFELE